MVCKDCGEPVCLAMDCPRMPEIKQAIGNGVLETKGESCQEQRLVMHRHGVTSVKLYCISHDSSDKMLFFECPVRFGGADLVSPSKPKHLFQKQGGLT